MAKISITNTVSTEVSAATAIDGPIVIEMAGCNDSQSDADTAYADTVDAVDADTVVSGADTLKFATHEDAVFCDNMSICTALLQMMYVFASSGIFCSSVMLHTPSNMDPLLGLLDLLVVDVTSASTVLLGVVCTHVYVSSTATPEMYRDFFASIYVDMWMSTILAVLFGGLYQLSLHSLNVYDLGVTVAEGLTSVRLFDFNQSMDAPHSINTFAWPVLCIVLPAYALPMTFRTTVWMHETLHEIGVLFIIWICVSGVLLVSIFASLHDESNIFYANASAVSYRCLEFNFGVNFYYLATINESFTMTLMVFAERVKYAILVVYVCVWWAEFGVPVVQRSTCIRIYHFGSCIQDHPGVFLRGCFLGVCIASWVTNVTCRLWTFYISIEGLVRLQSVILLCTPIFAAIKCVLNISFGYSIVNANAALLSICMPIAVYTASWAYNKYMKPKMKMEVLHLLHETTVRCTSSLVVCGDALRGCYERVTRASGLRGSVGPPVG